MLRSTILLSAVWLASWLINADPVVPLRGRANTTPSPISVPASQNWDGDDGPWSSFALQVGTPQQYVRVFVSTSSSATWLVLPDGCTGVGDATAIQSCQDNRGGVFTTNQSSTWQPKGYFSLSTEDSLGISASAEFGNDTITLGFMGSGGPTLQNQVIGAYAAAPNGQLFLGEFGVNPQPTNFSTIENGQASFLTSLKDQGMISSLSVGYTAGAPYRLKKVLGSLTLGGYDASRLNPNNSMSFTFGTDTSRDLIVGIQSITSVDADGTRRSLLPNGILANIDSTIPYIYLPLEACKAFEQAFGLVYDNKTGLYLLTDAQHSQLAGQNPNITFTLGNSKAGGPTINITLPYNSFDLTAQWPLVANGSKYFPLQRAANDSQYTLGRIFLQEAYLTVDWERSNFSLSECQFIDGSTEQLVTVTSPATTGGTIPTGPQGIPTSGTGSNGKTIGIALGVVLAALILVGGVAFYRFQKRRKSKTGKTEFEGSSVASEKGHTILKAELGAGIENSKYELKGEGEHQLFEIGNGSPTSSEGKSLSAHFTEHHASSSVSHELQGSIPYTGELQGSEPSSLQSTPRLRPASPSPRLSLTRRLSPSPSPSALQQIQQQQGQRPTRKTIPIMSQGTSRLGSVSPPLPLADFGSQSSTLGLSFASEGHSL